MGEVGVSEARRAASPDAMPVSLTAMEGTATAAGSPSVGDWDAPVRRCCPYLRSEAGQWRSSTPARDHICEAERPSLPIGPETQRRLCFDAFTTCERHRVAEERRRNLAAALPRRPVPRTAPMVIDRGRPPLLGRPSWIRGRSVPGHVGQAALIVVMVAAAGTLVLARGSGLGGQAGANPSSGPAGSPQASTPGGAAGSPSSGPAATTQSTPTAVVSTSAPTTLPTAPPTTSPAPPATAAPAHTYRVRVGDTLSSIAGRFNTTVRALAQLNGITNPALIRPGQILQLP